MLNLKMKRFMSLLFLCVVICFVFWANLKVCASSNDYCSFEAPEYSKEIEGEEYVLDTYTRSTESNVVHYNLITHEMEYLYLNNSFNTVEQVSDSKTTYTQDLSGDGDPITNSTLENDLVMVQNTSQNPYNKIGRISNGNFYGTAFMMGPNIALTAGHCVISGQTPRNFIDNLYIDFGYNGTSQRRVEVTDVYILKLFYDEFNFANDWAICIIDEKLGNEIGFFGKCAGYDLIGLEAKIIGYPGGQSTNSQYISTGEIVKNYPTFKYMAYVVGGFSGSPVFVTIDGIEYVAGIHSYDVDHKFAGAARISFFLFDFLNYFLEENNRGVELRDYYYEGLEKHRYNVMSELIISPKDDLELYLSNNNDIFERMYGSKSIFYTSTTSSTYVDYYYKYFKNYNRNTMSYSSVYSFDSYFSTQSRTAKYKTVDMTQPGDTISTMFDQSDNIWYHKSSAGHTIKGTIAYNQHAKNIEVAIPSSGTNLSMMVTIDNVSFQLRTGPYRVSLIASTNLICSEEIIFAFGID